MQPQTPAEPQSAAKVNRSEAIYALLIGLALAALTSIPYLVGAWHGRADLEFSGFVMGLEDGNSYLSKMLQGAQGDWFFRLTYSPEPHQGGLFYTFYLLLGKVSPLTGLSPLLVLHLARLLTVPLAVYAFYHLIAHFSAVPAIRRLALALFCFGAGLGWLWVMLGQPAGLGVMPVDIWVPESSFFLCALTFPHLPLKQALLFTFILFTVRYLEQGRRRDGVWATLTGLGGSLVHPYMVPVIAIPLEVYVVWQAAAGRAALWQTLRRLLGVSLPSLSYIAYAWWFFSANPVFSAWQAQNQTLSPAPYLYVLGFGLPLPFAVWGLVAQKKLARPHPFLLIWFVTVPFLLYIPFPLQRRFLDGYQALIALLAAQGLDMLFAHLNRIGWRTPVTVALSVIMVSSNILLWTGATVTAARLAPPVYQPDWQMSAIRWFWRDPTYPVVLASYATGNFLPAHAPVRSFVGHWSETVASHEKKVWLDRFFGAVPRSLPGNDTPDSWRIALLREFDVRYVFYGPYERELGRFDPGTAPYLHEVYDNGIVRIFQVDLPSTPPKRDEMALR